MTAQGRGRVEERGDSAGLILLLFALAMLIGLVVGVGAVRYNAEFGRPMALYRGSSAPKEVIDQGYHNESDYNADRLREQAVLTRLLASPVGSQALWENPETGNRGVIWVASEHRGAEICRDLVRHTLLNNAYRNTAATVCREPRGAFPERVAWHQE